MCCDDRYLKTQKKSYRFANLYSSDPTTVMIPAALPIDRAHCVCV